MLALVLCAAACGAGPDEGGFDFERMRRQPKYLSYGESRFFPDGRAMRVPPAGTVAYGGPVGPPALATGLEAGVPIARIPLAVTPELLERGGSASGSTARPATACWGTGGAPSRAT